MIFRKPYTISLAIVLLIAACNTIDVFEKDVRIPHHEWSAAFKPEVSFEISDTTALYNIYLVVRHSDAYRYNNIWLNVYTTIPNDTAVRKQRLDLRLATDDKGWLGSGMDDIFEHRVEIQQETKFSRPGTYSFTLEQIMREDPLKHVLDVGLRIEKAP